MIRGKLIYKKNHYLCGINLTHMEKIELPDECKFILLCIANNTFHPTLKEEEKGWLAILEHEGLIKQIKDAKGGCIISELTTKGRAYLAANPKLKNPSFWDDKNALVDHLINLVGLIKPF